MGLMGLMELMELMDRDVHQAQAHLVGDDRRAAGREGELDVVVDRVLKENAAMLPGA